MFSQTGGNISNLFVTGNVTGGSFVGGIVGQINSGSIDYVGNDVNVTSDGLGFVGGIAGKANASINNSYNMGTITASGEAGGLVGDLSGGSISDSYNQGTINASSAGSNPVGGLVGATFSGSISNSI